MKTYWNISGPLNTIKEWQPNCWIQVTCPTEQEQQELEETYNLPDYFLSDISDTDERARYEYDDGWMLIILRIPCLLYTSPSPRDAHESRMPSSA